MTRPRVLLVGVAACLASTLAACGQPANDAQNVAATIVHGLGPVHPETICDNGDAGAGIDNDIPWYTTYLYVDRTDNLDQVVVDAAAKAGYPLQRGSNLKADVDGRKVEVDVARTGEVTTRCREIDRWGASAAVRPGRAILTLNVTLPER